MGEHALKVISGGQTGVDQAALRAAKALKLVTGGTAPRGWLTEFGPAPWLAEYGLVQCDKAGYHVRTRENVLWADATIWYGSANTPGYRCTHRAAEDYEKPFYGLVDSLIPELAELLVEPHYKILNFAGNRESVSTGIGARAERAITTLLNTIAALRTA